MNKIRGFSELRVQSKLPDPGPGAPPPDKPSPKKPKPSKEGLLGGHITLDGGEHLAKAALEYKMEAHQAVTDALDAGVQTTKSLGSHATELGLSTGMMAATAGLGLASAGLGLYMLKMGAHDLREGLQHTNPVHAIEGANSMLVGVRSLAASVNLGSHMAPEVGWIAHSGHGAHAVLAPLGVVHGTVDAALGIHEFVQGVKKKDPHMVGVGFFGVGTGVSLAAAAAGGGVPALVSAGVCLAAKVGFSVLSDLKEDKPAH